MNDGILTFLGRESGFGFYNNSAYYTKDEKLLLFDCGMTVFNELRKKVNLANYTQVDVIITHLHPDHAGSLGQLIMYLWYNFKIVTHIHTNCQNIITFLDCVGVNRDFYVFGIDDNIQFINVPHVKELDSYGVILKLDNKKIIYTGDTSSLEPFLKDMFDSDELYIDVSKNSDVHIQINDVLPYLNEFKNNGRKSILNAY